MLEVNGLTKQFHGLVAVSDVTFEVPRAKISALIGPNGAGKTTTFSMIAGALKPTLGSVRFDGDDITGFKPNQVAAVGISRTFQVVRPMIGMNVLENAMIGALAKGAGLKEAESLASEALGMVGLADKLFQDASALTLPDRKMLEIARCLAMKPKLLLLDEAMAGLRPSESNNVIAVLKSLNERGLTIVLIEHVMRVVMSLAEHVIVLNHGQMIAKGTPRDIVNDEKVITSYLGSKEVRGSQT